MPQVFISYCHPEEAHAEELEGYLRRTLGESGVRVWRDPQLRGGAVFTQAIESAIDASDVAILLISERYLKSQYILAHELPHIRKRMGAGRSIIPVRLAPFLDSTAAQPECSWIWEHHARPKAPANLLEHYVHTHATQDLIYYEILKDCEEVCLAHRDSVQATSMGAENVYLIYDWADRRSVEQFVTKMRNKGVRLVWDQDWPWWKSYSDEASIRIGKSDLVLVYSTRNAQFSSWILSDLSLARKYGKRIVVLDKEPAKRHEVLLREEGVEPVSADHVVTALKIQPGTSPSRTQERRSVDRLLGDAFKANRRIPTDTMTDRLFLSPEACRLTEAAYERRNASRTPWQKRLQATLEYARLCRFRGTWEEGEKVLRDENDWDQDKILQAEYLMELGALVFERGDPKTGRARVREAYTLLMRRQIDERLVKVLRQIGNMQAEHDDIEETVKKLGAAIAFAEFLYNQDPSGEVGKARKLLWLDCRRELAALNLRRELPDQSLGDLRTLAEEAHALYPDGEHLEGVIYYHMGRAYHEHKHDDRQARTEFEKSIAILRKYDNPIRLAFLYDHLGRILTQHRPLGDRKEPLRLIERAERVRKAARHDYMVGRSHVSLGDYYRHNGEARKAIAAYGKAKKTLQRLDKPWAVAMACQALGVAYRQQNDGGQARKELREADKIYRGLGIERKVREIQYELFRLNPNVQALPLAKLVNAAQIQGHTLTVSEVGEYKFHQWIKTKVLGDARGSTRTVRVKDGFEELLEVCVAVDVGDDAAALSAIPSLENVEVVMTTDAAPGSICRSRDPLQGQYAGQFAVVQTISDLAAMGATPVAILLNLYLRRDATLEYAMNVVETVVGEAKKYGVVLIGGDMKERQEQSVGCVGVGVVASGRAIRRAGSEVGDILAITLGEHPETKETRKIGCRWAQEILEHRKLEGEGDFSGLCDASAKRRLLFTPSREMIAGAATGKIKSAIDTSDGFLACLQLLGRAAKDAVGFELDEESIDKVIDERVKEVAIKLALEPAQFLFNAGHDWEIVLTVGSEEDLADVRAAVKAARPGAEVMPLGRVCKPTRALAEGIAYCRRDGSRFWVPFFTDEKFVSRSYEERPFEWEDLSYYLGGRRELTNNNMFRTVHD